MINRIQNKSFSLHNICMCAVVIIIIIITVYLLCIYKYTHIVYSLKKISYFVTYINIFNFIYIKYIYLYFLKYIHACVFIYIYIINIHSTHSYIM